MQVFFKILPLKIEARKTALIAFKWWWDLYVDGLGLRCPGCEWLDTVLGRNISHRGFLFIQNIYRVIVAMMNQAAPGWFRFLILVHHSDYYPVNVLQWIENQ